MRVRYTPRAFSDLEVVRSYIAQLNPVAAGRVVALIEKIVARLGDFPESGQLSDDLMHAWSFRRGIPIVSTIGSCLVKS
jgi:plasmid stabilization system protein ParE